MTMLPCCPSFWCLRSCRISIISVAAVPRGKNRLPSCEVGVGLQSYGDDQDICSRTDFLKGSKYPSSECLAKTRKIMKIA